MSWVFPPDSTLSDADKAVVRELWELKCAHNDHFAHATLVERLDRPDIGLFIPAGTRVLVTTISRLGHVCFRHTDVDDVRHGYAVGADPEDLKDYKRVAAGRVEHIHDIASVEYVQVSSQPVPVKRNARGNRKRR